MGQKSDRSEKRGPLSMFSVPLVEVDYLVCGLCQRDFPLANIVTFMQHKKFDCDEFRDCQGARTRVLVCQSCPRKFNTPWRLLQHAQSVHSLCIYFDYVHSELPPDIANNYAPKNDEPVPTFEENDMMLINDLLQCSAKVSDNNIDKNLSLLQQHNYSAKSNATANLPLSEFHPTILAGPVEDVQATAGMISNNNNITTNSAVKQTEVAQDKSQMHCNEFGAIYLPSEVSEFPADVSINNSSIEMLKGGNNEQENTLQRVTVSNKPIKKGNQEGKLFSKSVGNTKRLSKQIKNNKSVKSAENEEEKCCDNQDCGITVMPGTHEELKKCCNAVIPKKRKRHMETKHMLLAGTSRRRSSSTSTSDKYGRKSSTKTVLIDIEDTLTNNQNRLSSTKSTLNLKSKNNVEGASKIKSNLSDKNSSYISSRSHSFIIEPGTESVLSIPVSSNTNSVLPPISTYFRDSNNSSKTKKENEKVDTNTLFGFLDLAQPKHHVIEGGQQAKSQFQELASNETGFFDSGNLSIHLSTESNGNVQFSQAGEHAPENYGSYSNEHGETVKDEVLSFRKRRYPTSKPFKCDQCQQAFNQRIHLKKHLSKHTGVKPFQCGQCDYSTVEKSHLKVHIRVHTGEKPFKCTYCEYATAQNSTLKIHLKRHHQGTDGVRCLQCKKEFLEPDCLTTHTKTEHQNNTRVIITIPEHNTEPQTVDKTPLVITGENTVVQDPDTISNVDSIITSSNNDEIICSTNIIDHVETVTDQVADFKKEDL